MQYFTDRADTAPRRALRVVVPEVLIWTVLAAVLAAVFGPALLAHAHRALHPYFANNDALQQIYPFYRYEDSTLLPRDYVADYYLACLPWGYRGLFMTAAHFDFMLMLGKLLPYAGLLVMCVSVAATAQRLAGRAAAFLALAICLGTNCYLWRMTGGLPRSFAYPVLGLAMALLAYGRLRTLAGLIPIAAGFYPVSAVVSGLALTLTLLGLPASSRGSASTWTLRKRLLVLALSAATAALVLLPTALASREYGGVIRTADLDKFPEAGPHGRYGRDSRAPFDSFTSDMQEVMKRVVHGDGEPFYRPWFDWTGHKDRGWLATLLCVFAGAGFIGLARVRDDARRVGMLGLAALIGHTIATPLVPYFYLPPRYVLYPIGVLAPVLVATAAAGYIAWWPRLRAHRFATPAAVLIAGIPLLLAFGGRGSRSKGLNDLVHNNRSVFRAIAALPKDAVIAGWPRGPLNSIPYLTARAVLVNFETHQAFHTGYALEMRERMHALIDAYYGTSLEPLIALRERFGVTHMLVNRAHFVGKPPNYFPPFKRHLRKAVRRGAGKYQIARMGKRLVALNQQFFLLDLRRLPSPPAS